MFVITGGGSGIGRALALTLAACQKRVLVLGRREALLREVANHSALISYCVADVASMTGRQVLIDALKDCPKLDGLVHNAATVVPITALSEMNEQAWHHALETNLNAPLFLSQMLYSKLKHARVLHLGSGVAHFAVKGWGAYCVSKAALYMLTQCWQIESQDIAFASVMPGIIDTDMQALIRQSQAMAPDKLAFFMDLKAQNRLISPDTVAQFLKWLLLDIPTERYIAQEWDIYDTAHHLSWLAAPHVVPSLEA